MNRAQAEALIRYIDAAIVAADGPAIGVFREHRNNALSAVLATVDEPLTDEELEGAFAKAVDAGCKRWRRGQR